MALARLTLITLDCDDPASLGAFWAALLDGEIAYSTDDVVLVKAEGGSLAMVRVTDYQPPTWPDGPRPKHMHLDLGVDDLDTAEAEAIRLGAQRVDTQPGPQAWRVLLDPAGHPFCLCDWSQPR